MAFLEVRNLSVGFKGEDGWKTVVKNVSFSVEEGSKLSVVGESGSGKSVTSLAVMGLLPNKNSRIENGQILLNGESLLDLEQEGVRSLRGKVMSMIFQEPMTSLNPLLTCGEQVKEVLSLHMSLSDDQCDQRVLELFNLVKLPRPEQMISQYPHQLSGGQKQRVMIALAMACNPRLLIADEPTTALDVTVQKEIIQLIDELVRELNMACIFITHDLGLVYEFSDHVLVMYKGEVVEEGRTSDVFEKPSQDYTKGLIACKPTLETDFYRLPTVMDVLKGGNGHDAKKLEFTGDGSVLLELKDVQVQYPLSSNWLGKVKDYVTAVDNVSFTVRKGETIGLVGESGCGKTTLGRSILGLEKLTSGDIKYNGESIKGYSAKNKKEYWRKVQIIFQDPYSSLNPRLTVGDAIVEVMQVHDIMGSKSERIEEAIRLLQKVGLDEDAFYRFPHEFSGGQRQRICIARTLAMKPELIICDESVSALDVSVQAQVLNLLNDLKEEFGLTYIFISHDLSVVKYMSDRLVVMQQGRLVEMGSAEEIYKSPKDEYTEKLIAAIPKV